MAEDPLAEVIADPYAPFYDREQLARLEAAGKWSLAHGVEAERLRQQGVIDERTMIPAGLVPGWLCGAWPGASTSPAPPIRPGRLRHGGSLDEGDPHG